MVTYHRGYRRIIANWLTEERDNDEPEDGDIDAVFEREAQLTHARRHLASNAEADDATVAKQFKLKRNDVYGLRMDLERYGEY